MKGFFSFIKLWFRTGHYVSWKIAFYTLLNLLYFNKHLQFDWIYKHIVTKKHKYVIEYTKKEMQETIEKYRSIKDNIDSAKINKTIWVCWLQGMENAPDIVKLCVNSINENANGAKVVLLTQDNISSYIELPSIINEKHEKGLITHANYTDILRFNLLAKYGGLWLDATILATEPIPHDVYSYPFYSLRWHEKKSPYVQNYKYHMFVVGGIKGGKLVSFIAEMITNYLCTHEALPDYYFIDYCAKIALEEFPDIVTSMEELPYTSERLYEMIEILSKPYNATDYKELSKEVILSKLNWHFNYKEKNSKNQLTYYGYLKKRYL